MLFQTNSIKIIFRWRWAHIPVMMLFLAMGCTSSKIGKYPDSTQPQSAHSGQGVSREPMPYRVRNITYYHLSSATGFVQEGIASWYGPNFNGKLTSNQEVYNMNKMTAAHKTLPFNTWVQVVNLENGREAKVRINDRGPFVDNRMIDLSYKAATTLGMVEQGTARVRVVALHDDTRKGIGNRSSHEESYAVQIGSFKDLNNAKQLARQTTNSRIISTTRSNTIYYQVVVGRYSNFDGAHERKERIQSQGFPNAFVIMKN